MIFDINADDDHTHAYVLGYIDAEDHIPNRAAERYTDELLRASYNTGYRTATNGYDIDNPQELASDA